VRIPHRRMTRGMIEVASNSKIFIKPIFHKISCSKLPYLKL
jgi:hypothetical protein